MIEVVGLTKYYGNKIGVDNVSFSIDKGETVGLLGPNGAGKTTIMKMLAGHMLPSSGSITIDGINVLDRPKEALKKIGFMPEIPPLYTEMEVKGYLNFIAEIKGVKSGSRAQHISEIMKLVAIDHVEGRLIKNLSKGYRQRVGLAHALVGFPPILILDEPTVGLDPKQITEVRKLIENLSHDHTIILSSHILPEIKMICKRIIIVSNGRIVLEDLISNLEEGGNTFTIKIKGEAKKIKGLLEQIKDMDAQLIDDLADPSSKYCRFLINSEDGIVQREKIFYLMAKEGHPIIEMKSIGNSLEEVFLDFTKEL